MNANTTALQVLLVEDNPGDVRLFQEALKDSTVTPHLDIVHNGEQAIQFLKQETPFENKTHPDLIILDLNLPRKSGHEVLEHIKTHQHTLQIPVIILTSSQAPEDIQKAYQNHANSYMVKPSQLNDFFDLVNTLEQFWLNQVQLPTQINPRKADEP